MISDYFDEVGLMTLKPGEKCDNGILFLSIYHVLNHLLGQHTGSFEYTQTIHACEVEPGLFHRAPGRNKDTEGFDDYVGVCAASVFLEQPQLAEAIVEYGNKHGWNFNNTEPGKFALWGWRQGAEIAFANICMGRRPELAQFIWLCLSFVWAGLAYGEDKMSEHQLTWLRGEAIKKVGLEKWAQPWFVLAHSFWHLCVWVRFGSLGRIFSGYYEDPRHPNRVMAETLYPA